ncbi:uncharacterized protein LOC129220607 [Uloborus diversus]|uniref:uncharacterized protein LOC129220607 n=1 Tax=Uloborus diversus TaxID=327109 RepID=UPI00240983C6|nr:uncharacterized protein LOC129220607 [Uloborus diversus]
MQFYPEMLYEDSQEIILTEAETVWNELSLERNPEERNDENQRNDPSSKSYTENQKEKYEENVQNELSLEFSRKIQKEKLDENPWNESSLECNTANQKQKHDENLWNESSLEFNRENQNQKRYERLWNEPSLEYNTENRKQKHDENLWNESSLEFNREKQNQKRYERVWNEFSLECNTENQTEKQDKQFSFDSQEIVMTDEANPGNYPSLQNSTEDQKEPLSFSYKDIPEKNLNNFGKLTIRSGNDTDSSRDGISTPLQFDKFVKSEPCIMQQKKCSDDIENLGSDDIILYAISEMKKSIHCSLPELSSVVNEKAKSLQTDDTESVCREDLNQISSNFDEVVLDGAMAVADDEAEIILNSDAENRQGKNCFSNESRENLNSPPFECDSVANYLQSNRDIVMKYLIEIVTNPSTPKGNDVNSSSSTHQSELSTNKVSKEIKTFFQKGAECSEQEQVCTFTLPRKEFHDPDLLNSESNIRTGNSLEFEISFDSENDNFKCKFEKLFGNESCVCECDFTDDDLEKAESFDFIPDDNYEIQQNEIITDSCDGELDVKRLIIDERDIKDFGSRRVKEKVKIVEQNSIVSVSREDESQDARQKATTAEEKSTVSLNTEIKTEGMKEQVSTVDSTASLNKEDGSKGVKEQVSTVDSTASLNKEDGSKGVKEQVTTVEEKSTVSLNTEIKTEGMKEQVSTVDSTASLNKEDGRKGVKEQVTTFEEKSTVSLNTEIKTEGMNEQVSTVDSTALLNKEDGSKRVKEQVTTVEEKSTVSLSTKIKTEEMKEQVSTFDSTASLNKEDGSKGVKEQVTTVEEKSTVSLNTEIKTEGMEEQVSTADSTALLNKEDGRKGVKEQVTTVKEKSAVSLNTEIKTEGMNERVSTVDSTASLNKEDGSKGVKEQVKAVEEKSIVSLNKEIKTEEMKEQVSTTDSTASLNKEDESKGNDPGAEEVYCTRDFDFCAEEEDWSSSQAGGSSDGENFHFHEGTDVSSAGECSSKSGLVSAISNGFSCGISEAHETHYGSTISDTTDETAESTVWNTRFGRAYETHPDPTVSATGVTDKAQESTTWSLTGGNKVFRGFASNIEQNGNVIDDYIIRPENVERKNSLEEIPAESEMDLALIIVWVASDILSQIRVVSNALGKLIL